MAHWTNLQWIKRFINLTPLYITCEKYGGLHLAELGLTAGSPADKIWHDLEFLRHAVDQNILIFHFVCLGDALFQQVLCISNVFSKETQLLGCFRECEILQSPMTSINSCYSLLLQWMMHTHTHTHIYIYWKLIIISVEITCI